eukprot:695875-Amphidinium_carterae.1
MEERIAKLEADKDNAVAQLTVVQDVVALKERLEEMQVPLPTIHAFDVFAHLQLGNMTQCGNVYQWPITVTLVRSCDASSLASALAPCKLCVFNEHAKCWVDTEALRQCVTRLLLSDGAAGGQQRW